jgi:hypothetical protein
MGVITGPGQGVGDLAGVHTRGWPAHGSRSWSRIRVMGFPSLRPGGDRRWSRRIAVRPRDVEDCPRHPYVFVL